MSYGYWGRVLRIDLADGTIVEENPPELDYRMYLGGAGWGTKVLADEVGPEVEPLAPESRLIFASGPYQGTRLAMSAKWSIVARSPLTGIFADSALGGGAGIRLKQVGYDAIVVSGRTEKPVYLWIGDPKVEIRDASHLWGRDAIDTYELLQQELGRRDLSAATIGLAGERMVAIACVVADGHSFAGRAGLGAVMGSKNLKAVAIRGGHRVPIANPNWAEELRRRLSARIQEEQAELRRHGTPKQVSSCEAMGDLPIQYWRGESWPEGAAQLSAPHYTEVLSAKPLPCLHCPVGCHRSIKLDRPDYALEGVGPEYESLGMLGSSCLVDDLVAVCKANEICNRLGIDTISAGAFVAFAMECYERGIVTENDVGFPLQWGDGKVLVRLVDQIGRREGFGTLFADGIAPAAAQIGKGAEEFALHVKNLDIPAHDPRAFLTQGVNYATGNRGACHLRGVPPVVEEVGTMPEMGIEKNDPDSVLADMSKIIAKYQDVSAVYNSLCQCMMSLGPLTVTNLTEYLNAVTGWDISPQELMQIGERIWVLQRQLNVRYGISRKEDKLPARFFEIAEAGGRVGRGIPNFQRELERYYTYRGYDNDGKPTAEKMAELGLTQYYSR